MHEAEKSCVYCNLTDPLENPSTVIFSTFSKKKLQSKIKTVTKFSQIISYFIFLHKHKVYAGEA